MNVGCCFTFTLKRQKYLVLQKARTPVCAVIRAKVSCVEPGVFTCGGSFPGDVGTCKK